MAIVLWRGVKQTLIIRGRNMVIGIRDSSKQGGDNLKREMIYGMR